MLFIHCGISNTICNLCLRPILCHELSYKYTIYMYCLSFTGKSFAVSHIHLYSTKNVHSYQQLQTFIVFMFKNSPKTFTVAKQSVKNTKVFQIIINIWYKKVVGYYEMIWCHVFIVDLLGNL